MGMHERLVEQSEILLFLNALKTTTSALKGRLTSTCKGADLTFLNEGRSVLDNCTKALKELESPAKLKRKQLCTGTKNPETKL